MSGIVGLVDGYPVARDLIEALGRLEHRGHDAAGIAVAGPGFGIRKVVGRSAGLDTALDRLDAAPMGGHAGIAQSSWAPFGGAEAPGADPFVWGGVAVVHDGLIQNQRELRMELRLALGANQREMAPSDNDAEGEVIPRLIAAARARGAAPMEAVRWATGRLRGAYSLAVLFQDQPDVLLVANHGSPIVVARNQTGSGVASDPRALRGLCEDYSPLEDGDIAELRPDGVRIHDRGGLLTERHWQKVMPDARVVPEEGYVYRTRGDIAGTRAALVRTDAALRDRAVPGAISAANRLLVLGVGSALRAAETARVWLERLSGLPVDVECAAEYCGRDAPPRQGSVAILVSRTGETADIVLARQMLAAQGLPCVALTEAPHSRLADGAALFWPTNAGPEAAPAATKSFSAQLLALLRLGQRIGAARGTLSGDALAEAELALAEAPVAAALAEAAEARFAAIACRLAQANEALLIGRGGGAAIAADGAQKLRELAQLPAHACAAGQLRHGAIALVHDAMPVIVCAEADARLASTVVDAEEARARGAQVIVLVESRATADFHHVAHDVVALPGRGLANLFAQAMAVQLIAYHTGLALGHDVDRPRNLMHAVGVE